MLTGFEPILRDWESRVLAIRRKHRTIYKAHPIIIFFGDNLIGLLLSIKIIKLHFISLTFYIYYTINFLKSQICVREEGELITPSSRKWKEKKGGKCAKRTWWPKWRDSNPQLQHPKCCRLPIDLHLDIKQDSLKSQQSSNKMALLINCCMSLQWCGRRDSNPHLAIISRRLWPIELHPHIMRDFDNARISAPSTLYLYISAAARNFNPLYKLEVIPLTSC